MQTFHTKRIFFDLTILNEGNQFNFALKRSPLRLATFTLVAFGIPFRLRRERRKASYQEGWRRHCPGWQKNQ